METPRIDADVQACIDGEVIRHLAGFQTWNRTFLACNVPAAVRQSEAGDDHRDSAAALAELDLIA